MNRLTFRMRSRSWRIAVGAFILIFVLGSSRVDAAVSGGAGDATAGDLTAIVEELQAKLVEWYADRDALEARLVQVEGESSAFRDDVVGRVDELRQRQSELQESLSDQIQALAEGLVLLSDDQYDQKVKLDNSIEELRLALDLLQQQVVGSADSLTNRVDALEEAGSVSAEQMDALSDSLHEELDSRLSAAVVRERRLESRLNELQEAFEEYRTSSEEEISGLRNTNNILVGVSVLTLVLSFVNAGSP